MIRALITGTLYGTPQARTAASGNPYATAGGICGNVHEQAPAIRKKGTPASTNRGSSREARENRLFQQLMQTHSRIWL